MNNRGAPGFLLVLVALMLLAFSMHPAEADPDADEPTADPTKSGAESSIQDYFVWIEERRDRDTASGGTTPRVVTSAQSSGTVRYVPYCDTPGALLCHQTAKCADGNEMLVRLFTPTNGTERYAGSVCPAESEPAAAPRITMGLVLRALKRVELPKPEIVVQPPGGRTLVNFDTLFRTEAGRLHRSVRLLGHRVELDITPVRYVWHHGDNTSQATTEPGVAYAEGLPMSAYVSHQYAEAT